MACPTKKQGEQEWFQISAISIACLVSLTYASLIGWTLSFMVKILNDEENYDITVDDTSYLLAIYVAVMCVFGLLFINLNDTVGRKTTLILITVPYTVAWIISIFAKEIWSFYLFRVISGIGNGCVYSSIPMYIGEISTPKVRGLWGNMMSFSIYLGQLLVIVLGNYFTVPQTAYICICIPVLFILIFSFMPESPYYYIMKREYENAKKSLRRLRRKHDVEEEFKTIKADVERQIYESGTWKDLFAIKNRKALLAGSFLTISHQFGGISVFLGYAKYFFERAGGTVERQISYIAFFGAITIVIVLTGFTLDKLGRRLSYFLSMLLSGIVLLILSIYFYLDSNVPSVDLSHLKWIPLAVMVLYVIFYSMGMGIVPTLMLGELFSTSIKVKGLTFLFILHGLLILISTEILYFLLYNYGLYSAFLLYCANCCVSTILVYRLVPETKGKTLEEIQLDLKKIRRHQNSAQETSYV